MHRKALVGVLLALLFSTPAFAQRGYYTTEPGWEITPYFGWKSGGNLELVPQNNVGAIHANDGILAGLAIGNTPRPDFTFEVRYAYQHSGIFFKPNIGGNVDLADMNIHQVMGDFLFSEPGRTASSAPFFLLGLGANIFDPGQTSAALGTPRNLRSKTKFTWSLGLGVKHMMNAGTGVRLEGRFNPTYITSSPGGYWCDPFYGCYTSSNAHYFDQWEFSAGFIKKLGFHR